MALALNRKKIRFYLQLATAFLLLNLLGSLISSPGTFLKKTVNLTWAISYLFFFNFILFEFTIPFIKLSWRRLLAGIFLLFIHILFYSFGLYAWRNLGISLHVYFSLTEFTKPYSGESYFMGISMASVLFFGIVRHVYNYTELKNAEKKLRIEKQEAELNFLRSQTNPHFLFNTLNNIYALSRDKSDLAPESILRLSKILRFMLYETSSNYIAIEQELKIISDYIALEKLRYDDSLCINFNHDIEDMKQALPPLLLIPLVENAFKHGVSETRYQPFIDIHLSVNKRQLLFWVKNSAEQNPAQPGSTAAIKESIGLSNLRRQLELQYKDFSLSVEQQQPVFTATLKINLSSHA
jgi:two-component system, LytTR family, sensor kinase